MKRAGECANVHHLSRFNPFISYEAITEAVSLLELKQEKNRINKRIQSLLHIADDLAPDSVEYQCVYERILELERMRD